MPFLCPAERIIIFNLGFGVQRAITGFGIIKDSLGDYTEHYLGHGESGPLCVKTLSFVTNYKKMSMCFYLLKIIRT